MTGSFTWSAIVQIGTLKPYPNALVVTVVHEFEHFNHQEGAQTTPIWNTILCFKDALRSKLEVALAPGDLVHFQGYVRTTTFTDDSDATRRAVDLVITQYDVLNKHIQAIPDRTDS